MTKLRALAVLLVLTALLSWPCGKRTGVRGIELSVTFGSRILTDDLFTEIVYRFKTMPSFAPMAEDNIVVTEMVNRGREVVRDAFGPPVPTSKWEPGREYVFTRRTYIPAFIDEFAPSFRGAERAGLTVGLASPSDKVQSPRLILFARKLRITPGPGTPTIVFLTGWFPPEPDASSPWKTWRWTGGEARVAVDSPGRDSLLVVRGRGGAGAPPGQKVRLNIDGRTLEEFVPGEGEFEKVYPIDAAELAGRKDFVLSIGVDKTFVPAKVIPGSTDERELGVRISLVYFRPR